MRIPIAASLLAFAACASESEQAMSTTSTVGGVSTSAPPAAEAARRSNAFVRFVQAVPDGGSVDVYSNDMRAFTGIAFGTVTPYRELPKDRYAFRIRPANQDIVLPIAEEKESVSAGEHYTIVAIRDAKEAKAKLKVFQDELTPPEAGFAKLRLINASPDVGEIDLFTPGGEKPVFSDVNYGSATKYAEIRPMSGRIELHRDDEKTPLATLPEQRFEVGRIYTVIVCGWVPAGTTGVQSVTIEDRFVSR